MTLGHWLINIQHRAAGTAIQYKQGDSWQSISWEQYLEKTITIAEQIKNLSKGKNKHVGILSSTRWEWAIIDMAILGSGRITIPLYANQSDDDLLFIINHSDMDLLIIENENFLKQIKRIESQLTRKVSFKLFSDLDFHESASEPSKKSFFKSCEALKPQEPATIVYTSGTTGVPKGAVLTHESIVSEVEEIFRIVGVKSTYTSLTFLPFAHVMGRAELWGNCFIGHTMAFAESIESIKQNLLEIQPDFMIAVPRIFEKVYAGIMTQIETQPLKQKLFEKAISISDEVRHYRDTRQSIPWPLLVQYETICRLAFAPIKKAFGGKLLFAVSGGAPLGLELTNFFAACGIQVLEGYGLTETCAAIAVNTPFNFNPGTVGRPLGEAQIKFAADGEILVKSKKCMKEYYKNPEATALVFENGYFLTGDIGEMTRTGQLRITDRKKDLIKTANGKYVAPQKLEGLVKQDTLISQVLIHGDQKKFITAIISIEENEARKWAQSQNLNFNSVSEIYKNPALHMRVQKHIQKLNSNLANHEAIKKFEIVGDTWSIENGCMTPSLKTKRKFLEKKYQSLLAEMYGD